MHQETTLRRWEYALLVVVPWALYQSADWNFGYRNPLEKWLTDWLELLLLFAWCAAPIKMRPLTTPGVTIQQRYAVGGLILAAGLSWFLFLAAEGSSGDAPLGGYDDPSALSVLTISGLLAIAGYLRIGWAKGEKKQ